MVLCYQSNEVEFESYQDLAESVSQRLILPGGGGQQGEVPNGYVFVLDTKKSDYQRIRIKCIIREFSRVIES